jgi:hypothetical protein
MKTRETITEALFQLLVSGSDFATVGRRLKWYTDVTEQPAMFLRNRAETWERLNTRMPAKVLMNFEVWLYSNQGADPDIPPSVGLNELIATVGGLLLPPPGREAQTLGGQVAHCWIEGEVTIESGDLAGQAIAIIPVKALVPTFGG